MVEKEIKIYYHPETKNGPRYNKDPRKIYEFSRSVEKIKQEEEGNYVFQNMKYYIMYAVFRIQSKKDPYERPDKKTGKWNRQRGLKREPYFAQRRKNNANSQGEVKADLPKSGEVTSKRGKEDK
jgi:hypothetical protein